MMLGIAACLPEQGQVGAALASSVVAGGWRQLSIRPNAGVIVSSNVQSGAGPGVALDFLAANFAAPYVCDKTLALGESWSSAQLIVVDRYGGCAGSEGCDTAACASHEQDGTAISFGHLSAPGALSAMLAQMQMHDHSSLDVRLIRALEAGFHAAQCLRGSLVSAAVAVFGSNSASLIDLRVDLHEEPVAELSSLFGEYQHYKAYYRRRSDQPTITEPQEVFARELALRLAKEKA